MSRNVVVVAAHPDDEVLGAGGTIARHVADGDCVQVVFMADGVASRNGGDQGADIRRSQAANAALGILGVSQCHYLGCSDNAMDETTVLTVVKKLEPVLRNCSPGVIYTHHFGDLNIDHRITQQAVMTICRPQPGETCREIYGFEVLSSTEWQTVGDRPFLPSLFVDISSFVDRKLMALNAYAEEMRAVPHSRSVEHSELLARHRGHSVGVMHAEAFEVYRIIR
jgi:LmbE family N-acetylglucosaminyl deacetylase